MRKSLDQRKSVARVPQGHLSAELAPPVPRPSSRPWQRDNKWPYCYRWLTPISSMPVSEEGITLQPSLIWHYGHTSEPSQYCTGFIWLSLHFIWGCPPWISVCPLLKLAAMCLPPLEWNPGINLVDFDGVCIHDSTRLSLIGIGL